MFQWGDLSNTHKKSVVSLCEPRVVNLSSSSLPTKKSKKTRRIAKVHFFFRVAPLYIADGPMTCGRNDLLNKKNVFQLSVKGPLCKAVFICWFDSLFFFANGWRLFLIVIGCHGAQRLPTYPPHPSSISDVNPSMAVIVVRTDTIRMISRQIRFVYGRYRKNRTIVLFIDPIRPDTPLYFLQQPRMLIDPVYV